MITNGYCLPFKDKQDSLNNDESISDNRYSNLNLNQTPQNSSDAFLINSKNDEIGRNQSLSNFENCSLKKLLDSDVANVNSEVRKDSIKWRNKKTKTLSSNYRDSDSVKKGEKDSDCKTKSTLSLHIAAYENSNEGIASEKIGGFKADNEKHGFKNKEQKQILVDSIADIGKNPLEFPRQQENEDATVPNIAQFKASQKLINPNQHHHHSTSSASPPPLNMNKQQQIKKFVSASNILDPPSQHQQSRKVTSVENYLNPSLASSSSRYQPQPTHGVFSDTFIMRDQQQQHYDGSWTEGKEIAEREHNGTVLSFPISMSCDVCKKRFGFTRNALECRDCNLRFHRQCQALAPMPCIPKSTIIQSPTRQKCILIDFCSKSHPYIPSIIIHCTIALESEHLDREGIYRISGTVSSVTKLLNSFLSSRVIPDLSNVPTENITGCIKKFLKELRDSVVPSTSYETFMQAIEENDDQKVITSVFELPAPNRDTLAYLILHLQKVAQYSSKNKMPSENLARVLAPTIIGYSKRLPFKMAEEFTVNCNQTMILHRLLKLPPEFWSQFIENNVSQFAAVEGNIRTSPSSLSSRQPTTAGIYEIPPPAMPRSYSSRFRRRNNNIKKAGKESETDDEKPPKASPLMRSLSVASSFVRSFKSAF